MSRCFPRCIACIVVCDVSAHVLPELLGRFSLRVFFLQGLDGVVRDFDHPFVQSGAMFVGELACLVVFRVATFVERRRERRTKPQLNLSLNADMAIDGFDDPSLDERGGGKPTNFNPLIFVVPAACDLTATSLMYLGLTLTYASVFQMLRYATAASVCSVSIMFSEHRRCT